MFILPKMQVFRSMANLPVKHSIANCRDEYKHKTQLQIFFNMIILKSVNYATLPHIDFLSHLLLWDYFTEGKKRKKILIFLVRKTDHQNFFHGSLQQKNKTLIGEVHWSSLICQEQGYAIKNIS